MNINDPADPLLPPPKEGHHRSARERQRKGPMWGCLKGLIWFFGILFLVLFVIIGGGWWVLGTTNFADYVRKKVEGTLEAKLGRDVTIKSVEFVRTSPQKIILNDLRIANAPGTVAPLFASARQVEITGGIQSFWGLHVKVDRVDIRDPRLWFEILPDGNHNFPKWKTDPRRRRFEIMHLDIGKLFVTGGAFSFNDRKHEILAVAQNVDSTVTVTKAEDLYAGFMNSPLMRVRIQDYEPFDVGMRGSFRFTPGVLALQSVALRGRGLDAFLSGKIDPLSEAVYDLRLTSRLSLERIREIFRLEQTLEGTLALDTRLHGKSGDFEMSGGWSAPKIVADTYELTTANGRLKITDQDLIVAVEKATYGGGTIAADYSLATYADPYPMKVDLRYYNIGIEPLFSDWGVDNTGLRGGATGNLTYRWNKDDVLGGSGTGTARLTKSAVAFSRARYPIPVSGTTDFALDRGVVTFRSAELDTAASHVSLTGTLRIEGVVTDLKMAIRSTDFSELDRLGFNFAQSAGKTDYELLGLGGTGTITGSVNGPIEKPQVAATIAGSQVRYNEVLLGDANIDLRYNGNTSTLTFERAQFADGAGRLALTGTIAFPDSGPGPRFDIAVDANGYPAQRAIDAVGLEMQIGAGLATGKLIVAGTPENGRATFVNTVIRRADATLALNGDINWLPGEGNVAFDLDIAATNFPITDIASFLEFTDIPATGKLTGTLKIAGRKESLEGSGSVTVREGTIMDEPVELASADIVFTQGKMRATNVIVRAVAGEIRGEAEIDLGTEHFSYTIESTSIDPSKLKIAEGLADLLGGRIILKSTGAGSFEQPELVVEATLEDATLRGLNLPPGTAPPSIYLAIRNGRLIVRGAIADIVTIEGEGAVGPNMALDGTVRVTINDLKRAMAISPTTSSLPVSGSVVVDLRLGGQLSPIEALVVEASVPVFNVTFADAEFTAPQPLRIALRKGRIEFDSFVLRRSDSSFAVTGFAELTGAKNVDVNVTGRIEAALLQIFVPDARAEGHMDVAIGIEGTIATPIIRGTADLVDAQVRIAGFPQLLDEINGRLRFGTDRIDIESLRATVGGGTVVAGGFITVEGLKPQRARITLQGTDVAFRGYEGVTVEGNFTLLVAGDLERSTITGDVDVTRALYFRDFDIQQMLLDLILARTTVAPTAVASWQDRVALRIHLTASDTLAVRNNIAEVTGSADLEVAGTVANPVITGEVTLDEGGTVRIQSVDYRMVRGTISFQNPFRIDPYLDVTLEGTVSGFGSENESGPFEVTVNLTGTLDRMIPTITSDPPASDITLFSLLGFGGLAADSTGGATQAGLGAGLGMMGQSFLGSLIGSRVFPFVDSFSYDPGTLDTGGSGSKVTFEKRLSNKVRLLLTYNLDNQESREVIEWLVNRDWSLQLMRDEADEYRLEARFRRRYEAHWEFRNAKKDEDFAEAATLSAPGSSPAPHAPLAALPPAPPVTPVNPRAADNERIAAIHFRADARFDTNAVASEVTLQQGEVVTIRELQSSIKNLSGTGNFRDVRVDAARAPEGVTLTFSLFLHYRIDEIVLDGIPRTERARALREITVRNGEVLSLDAVDDSASSVQDILHRYGYLDATVDPETTFDRLRSLADVTLHVTPGERAKIANVILEGDPAPFTTPQLIDAMRRKQGSPFLIGEAREDANRIRNFLVRRDYRRADVDFLDHVYDLATHGVTLRYRVAVGPKVEVAVEGIERGAVRKWLPFGRNQEYSEDAVEQAANKIVNGLQERGHYTAAVDTETALDRKKNVWTTTFHVTAGPRYRLAGVEFEGNATISDKQLRGVVSSAPPGAFVRSIRTLFRQPNGVTREQVGDDREALESYYRLQGFSEAAAATPDVKLNDAAGTMTVAFTVTEGPQTIVKTVTTEGIEEIHTRKMPELKLEAGQPLNLQFVQEDRVALQTYFANTGHTEVQVAPRVAVSEDKTSATVTYVVAEGPHIDIGEVVVRGNTYTDRDVVLRRSELDPGDPFSYQSLLEAQQDLYRLGIFDRVEIDPQRAGTTSSDRDVVIHVEEGKNLTLAGSIGLRLARGQTDFNGDTETPTGEEPPDEISSSGGGTELHERFSIAAAHRNLFGTGRYLGLELVFGREEQEAFLTYREPFVSRWDVPLQLQIFQSDDSTRIGTTILQRGLSIEASKVSRRRTRWSVRYEYRISTCEGDELCERLRENKPIETLDPELQTIQISSITPTFFWDTRNDIIDPHRGFFGSGAIEYAFPMLSANAHFLKEYIQGAWYIPLSKQTVVALAGRVGLIQNFARKLPEIGQLEGDELPIPLSERFTAGGENTHRAFPLELLGNLCVDPEEPVDCEPTLFRETENSRVLPLGGSGLFLLNAEYRFPIFTSVGGAIFADVGNVFAKTIRFDNLRWGAGFGLRYLSPVGPIRVDLGVPFKRYESYEKDSFQYFITLGYAF